MVIQTLKSNLSSVKGDKKCVMLNNIEERDCIIKNCLASERDTKFNYTETFQVYKVRKANFSSLLQFIMSK